MLARIHRYQPARLLPDGMYETSRQMLAGLDKIPGFVSFVIVDLDAAGLTSVCVCEDRAALDEAGRITDGWLSDQLGRLDAGAGQVSSGEVVLQRGL